MEREKNREGKKRGKSGEGMGRKGRSQPPPQIFWPRTAPASTETRTIKTDFSIWTTNVIGNSIIAVLAKLFSADMYVVRCHKITRGKAGGSAVPS